jgi:PAS domain-containing protein
LTYLTNVVAGVEDLDRLIDLFMVPSPLILSAMQTAWVMIVQSADPLTIPPGVIGTKSPSPTEPQTAAFPTPTRAATTTPEQTPTSSFTHTPLLTPEQTQPPLPTSSPMATETVSISDMPDASATPVASTLPPEGVLFWNLYSAYGQEFEFFRRSSQIYLANLSISDTVDSIAEGFWGVHNPLKYWSPSADIDLFRDYLPIDDPEDIPLPMMDIERLFVTEQHLLPEVVICQIMQWFLFLRDYRLPLFAMDTQPYFPSQLTYFLTTVLDKDRLRPLIDSVLKSSEDDEIILEDLADALMVLVGVIQAFMFLFLTMFLIRMNADLNLGLKLLLFFPPAVVLQNITVAELLANGEANEKEGAASFEHAEKVISHSQDPVILADRDLIVRDCNAAAIRIFGIDSEQVSDRPLADILVAPPDRPAISGALAVIQDAIHGIAGPPIPETIPVAVAESVKIISLRPTYVTELGAFTRGQTVADIRGVILQITDLTEQKLREQAIETEVSSVRGMLERVLPAPIVKQLADGTESVAFAVQSATIGCIRIVHKERELSVEDRFGGIHKLFLVFDRLIEPFQQLTKVSVLSNEYVYAGGIFTATNRPDKHGEEAVRFALKILNSREEIEAVTPPGATLLIGLNTGGPLIAGVMSAERPGFQLLGVPVELARFLALAGEARQLHVTRSVYELVYSHNFKVTERGDLPLPGGKSVHTYVITA